MEISCDIIRDLLPLYAEELTRGPHLISVHGRRRHAPPACSKEGGLFAEPEFFRDLFRQRTFD